MTRVYKILSAAEHAELRALGRFDGAEADRADGFIHLSTAEQLSGTLRKHFAGRDDLVLLALDADRLGAALRWEPSRGGALFPHLYGPFGMDVVLADTPLGPFARAVADLPGVLAGLADPLRRGK